MALYGQALRELGGWLGGRSALEAVAGASGSAERLAGQLAEGMAMFGDRGLYKRARIVPTDLALAGGHLPRQATACLRRQPRPARAPGEGVRTSASLRTSTSSASCASAGNVRCTPTRAARRPPGGVAAEFARQLMEPRPSGGLQRRGIRATTAAASTTDLDRRRRADGRSTTIATMPCSSNSRARPRGDWVASKPAPFDPPSAPRPLGHLLVRARSQIAEEITRGAGFSSRSRR